MAALVVKSRFAGLKIEDDDCSSDAGTNENKTKTNNAKKQESVSKKTAKNNNTKSQSAAKKKKAKVNSVTSAQWEQWKQKDEEMVDGNFEDELQQAILLSKLDFEEKKDVYKQIKKQTENQKKIEEQAVKNKNKKLKKKNVMSLDQFNDMVNGDDNSKIIQDEDKDCEEIKTNADTEFFERVKCETKSELLKDKIIDRVKNRLAASDEVITRVQYLDTLEKKDKEIAALRQEVSNLKQELLTVKSRNKKLCNILGQGEMKDKAEVLVEVERLRSVQAELNAELASLHTDLEKERSKNTDPRTKDKKNSSKKKNIRFDVSSEAILTKESSSGTAG